MEKHIAGIPAVSFNEVAGERGVCTSDWLLTLQISGIPSCTWLQFTLSHNLKNVPLFNRPENVF